MIKVDWFSSLFSSVASQEAHKLRKMDLAASWLCVVFLYVTKFTFIGEGFRIAAANIPASVIKRIVPDRHVMN